MKKRKIPERTCIACGKLKPKGEMLRIVKSSDGRIAPDPSGKLNGRGAYVCESMECLDILKKKHKLEKAFSCSIAGEVYEAIENEIKNSQSSDDLS